MFVSVDISPICYLTFQKATYESDIFNYLHFIINDYDLRVGLEKYIIASNTTKKNRSISDTVNDVREENVGSVLPFPTLAK